jgi:hypothetical protein
MQMSKRGDTAVGLTLFGFTIVVAIILAVFVLGSILMRSNLENKGVESEKLLEINLYMSDFAGLLDGVREGAEFSLCEVDLDSKVLNAPCSCLVSGTLGLGEDGEDVVFNTCLEGEYCYYGETGCSENKR